MTEKVETRAGLLYESALLSKVGDIEHGFGTRGATARDYIRAMDYEINFIPVTDQMHGGEVFTLTGFEGDSVIEADAFITNVPKVLCFVRSADCVPILLADKRLPAVGAVHAGWRGTARDVAGNAVREMGREFGAKAEDIVACIGPSICPRCFEVGGEVFEAFDKLGIYGWRADDRHIDITAANRALLVKAGVPAENIETIEECTLCNEEFASYRRDKSESERQFSFIFIA